MLLSHHEVTEHILLPLPELQPEGNLLGAGIHGERITPKKGGGDQVICHAGTLSGAVLCHLQCLRVKPQSAGHQKCHQNRTAQHPMSLNTYRRGCGSLRKKSPRGDTALQTSGIWEWPDNILSALYFCKWVLFPCFFPFFLQSAISLLCLQLPCNGRGEESASFVGRGKRISGTARMLVCLKEVCKAMNVPEPEGWMIHIPFYSLLEGCSVQK